jgi:hypothetical protein
MQRQLIDLFGIQSSQESMMTPHLPTSTRNAALSYKGGGSSRRKEGKVKDLNSAEEEDDEEY